MMPTLHVRLICHIPSMSPCLDPGDTTYDGYGFFRVLHLNPKELPPTHASEPFTCQHGKQAQVVNATMQVQHLPSESVNNK